MFTNEQLTNYLNKSSSVNIQSRIIAEWNMNIPQNFSIIGNYRNRPTDISSQYHTAPSHFDILDTGNFYTGATDSDITIDGGYDDSNQALAFTSPLKMQALLFSLEDCLNKNRPRSGINKAKYGRQFFNFSNIDMAKRPRYYIATKQDNFKYWTSDRLDQSTPRGISFGSIAGSYPIDDAAPFVVYNDPVPSNRIVVKMQTHIGTIDKGSFINPATGKLTTDPFYGYANSQTPSKWKIQVLDEDTWNDAVNFNPQDKRFDGTPIIGPDGYVEIYYGLKIPQEYSNIFNFKRVFLTDQMLPINPEIGSSYLIKTTDADPGIMYVYTTSGYKSFPVNYGWSLSQNEVIDYRNSVTHLSNPEYFISDITQTKHYSKFQNIRGIRVIVDQMNTRGSSFDLIEISPRLVADITDTVESFSVIKSASDLGNAGMPVAQLLASTGTISIFDYDEAFNPNNTDSLIAPYLDQMIKFALYETIQDDAGNSYLIPIKTLYSSARPQIQGGTRDIKIDLRDLMFLLENSIAPEILMTDVSLSFAISTLLDNIGFSNYKFLRVDGETDLIIPYFYVAPDTSVLQILQDLAVSAQSAMFFNEENDLVIMSKNYMMPAINQRSTDYIISGEKNDFLNANIEDISTQDSKVFNDGQISYKERYIQRSYGSIKQSTLNDRNKTWIYKPVLLWEVSGSINSKTQNSDLTTASTYTLSAVPLNSDLSDKEPSVVNHQITNNIIDFGEGSYFLTRYDGYFFSNGEIIHYDAIEYSIPDGPGNVWIQSTQEYSNYFENVKFNKSMFPTGRVRIFTEPFYEIVNGVTQFKNGPVNSHGRAQFGTSITSHSSGLSQEWSDNSTNPTRGAKVIFNDMLSADVKNAKTISQGAQIGNAGIANSVVAGTTRNGVIKNALGLTEKTQTDINKLSIADIGTVQSSALILNGPSFTSDVNAIDLLSYVPKNLNNPYIHFGTRMRIIGRQENGSNQIQVPNGSMGYFDDGKVGGASGGLAVMLNPTTNNGYYFEIMALTSNSVSDSTGANVSMNNVVFYKLKSDGSGNSVPVKLWSGVANILTDTGDFSGQSRFYAQQYPTVYDLAVEYEEIANSSTRRFFLYINNQCIAVVDDEDKLPVYNSIAPFIRGTSRVMFENLYAINKAYSLNPGVNTNAPINSIFGDTSVSANEALRTYSLSGAIQQTYLSDISTKTGPSYDLYFEEFGTIMREAAYFKIKYDKAYPALHAQIAPTFNNLKGYTVSGFVPQAYGAEFLVFNNTDTIISLDETTGNYLRIQGVTFTQNSDKTLTLDDFFKTNSSKSNIDILKTNPLGTPTRAQKEFFDIKSSRATYGKNAFSITANYIQNADAANELMSWLISKTIKPRKSVGLSVFAGSVLQLGDIVQIFWTDSNGIDQIIDRSKRFVVYSIDYSVSPQGPQSNIFLSEVI